MIKLERPLCPNPEALNNKNYKHPDNKQALKKSGNDKCMYCESKISHIDFAHVEHIKPKAEYKYPELTYEWSNLGYACPKCNNSKSDKYDPDCPYIDPYTETPNEHLYAVGTFLMPRNGSERGELSIIDISLNRPELLEKRLAKLNEIQKAINFCYRTKNSSLRMAALEQLNEEALPNKEYSLFVKTMLLANAGP